MARLEVQIRAVDGMSEEAAKQAVQIAVVESGGRKDAPARDLQCILGHRLSHRFSIGLIANPAAGDRGPGSAREPRRRASLRAPQRSRPRRAEAARVLRPTRSPAWLS